MKQSVVGIIVVSGVLYAASPLSPAVPQGKNLYRPLPKSLDLAHEKTLQRNDQNSSRVGGKE